jgi:hypothetical protein
VIKKCLFFLSFFLLVDCTAQLIHVKPTDVSLGPMNFNQEYIRQNKVKTITLDIVDKPDGAVIVDKDAIQGYEFDTSGRLIRYYYTILTKTETQEMVVPPIIKRGKVVRAGSTKSVTQFVNDTIFVNVAYDNHNRVVSKRVRVGDFYHAFYYEYNDKHQLKKEIHFKETNVSENKREFTLGVQTLLSSERFEYTTLTPTQIKKSCMNDEGREYKKAIINYDARGNKISETYEFVVSWMRQDNNYVYDENNRLINKMNRSNENGDQKLYSLYIYGDKNALLTEQKYKADQLTNEISYLYDGANVLVKSHINRDFKNASIGIVKYSYTFY